MKSVTQVNRTISNRNVLWGIIRRGSFERGDNFANIGIRRKYSISDVASYRGYNIIKTLYRWGNAMEIA